MRQFDSKLRNAYPKGEFIKGKMPLPVRILQVLDCFEGLIHMRAYKNLDGKNEAGRPARTVAQALSVLVKEANAGVLDPLVVHTFINERLYEPAFGFRTTTFSTKEQPCKIKEFDTERGQIGTFPEEFQELYCKETEAARHALLTGEINNIDTNGINTEMLSSMARDADEFRRRVHIAMMKKVYMDGASPFASLTGPRERTGGVTLSSSPDVGKGIVLH